MFNYFHTDLHIHSTFSSDGHNSPVELCQQALSLGLKAIAITDHAEWHHTQPGFRQVDDYFKVIDRCKAHFAPLGLQVYSGVELGNPHIYSTETAKLLKAHQFDIVIGSLHYLYDENIHLPGCFANREPYQVFADYFAELGRLSAYTDCDIIAHFDRILWRASLLGIVFNPHKLEPVIRAAFATIIRRKQMLELNTRLLDHQPDWHVALSTMIRWYQEAGGDRLIVNSDAHRAEDIAINFNIARKLLTTTNILQPMLQLA